MRNDRREAGFSYVDVMISVTILLVGIMALVAAITRGVSMTTESQEMLVAKQVASSTVEAIFSARDLDRLGWEAIGNSDDADIPEGVFPSGMQDIYPTPGEDGIVGTDDDHAGPDGDPGNSDDGEPVHGYQRQIVITNLPDPNRPDSPITLREVRVRVSYTVGGRQRQETFTSYIANYREEQD